MGEIAEMMLDGTMCAGCGEWLHDGEDGDGYPGYCSSCAGDYDDQPAKPKVYGPTKARQKAAEAAMRAVEKELKCFTPDPLRDHAIKSILGLLKPFYGEEGIVRHRGMETTIENNKQAQLKAKQRQAKKARKS